METDIFVNLFGLARVLSLPRDWLKGEADAGRIPFLRIGRQRFYNPNAVRERLAARAAIGEEAQREIADAR